MEQNQHPRPAEQKIDFGAIGSAIKKHRKLYYKTLPGISDVFGEFLWGESQWDELASGGRRFYAIPLSRLDEKFGL